MEQSGVLVGLITRRSMEDYWSWPNLSNSNPSLAISFYLS